METAGISERDIESRLPRSTVVKNKSAATVQITSEQIVREAKQLQEKDFQAPTQHITNEAELGEYRLRKRKEWEDVLRMKRWNLSIWAKYASWEEQQKDYRRARSVWERCLDIQHTSVPTWLKYAEMEMRNRFVNHARNIWDRAVTILPRVDQLWYKYIHMEEMLGNIAGARQVFERWMKWEPDHNGWAAFIKMELRYKENDRARDIYERYVQCLPTIKAWVRYAKFEFNAGDVARARAVYERAVQLLDGETAIEALFLKFAEFEEKVKEVERARAIYRYALDHIPKAQATAVFQRAIAFEKQHGDRSGIEDVIVGQRRFQYEEEVARNSHNYDAWFDYCRLEESAGDPDKIREVYERAIGNVPLPLDAPAKRFWQRYIYLWLNYAVWEELEAEDAERTREVYRNCLKLIPHDIFTFAKVWIMAAQFEIRQQRLDAARRILGIAIGTCPKDKLFKAYIDTEHSLGNMDRCRRLYEKYLEWDATRCASWARFAELENSLDETERARGIYELAIAQPQLDMPELLWKAYIDMEVGEGQREAARKLYKRLLERTGHVKVWLSYAAFEAAPLPLLLEDNSEASPETAAQAAEDAGGSEAAAVREVTARSVYESAFRQLRLTQPDAKEEAVMLLEAWLEFEGQTSRCDEDRAASLAAVQKKQPRQVKRKRRVVTEGGVDAGMEEYLDYIFPDEAGAAPNLKLLEAAQRWKAAQAAAAADADTAETS